MDNRPRLATTAEKADLAILLAKRRYPHYPFVSIDEIERVAKRVVFEATITVLDGNRSGLKEMLVRWHDDHEPAESFFWFNGALEPLPEWELSFDELPF